MRLPSDHSWLIELMDSLGYEVDTPGLCDGIAYAAVENYLKNEMPAFYERLQWSYSHRHSEECVGCDEKSKEIFECILSHHNSKKSLTTSWEGGESKAAVDSSCLMTRYTGIYSAHELLALLEGIQQHFNQQAVGQFGLRLRCQDHSLMLGCKDRQWVCCGAPHIDNDTLYTLDALVPIIMKSLCHRFCTAEALIALSTECYVNSSALLKAQIAIASWQSTPTHSALHSVEKKKNAEDVHGATWLNLAILDEDYTVAHSLLKAGANPDGGSSKRLSPLHCCIHNHNLPMATLLCEHAANPSQLNEDEISPFELARCCNDTKMADFFFEKEYAHLIRCCQEKNIEKAMAIYDSEDLRGAIKEKGKKKLLELAREYQFPYDIYRHICTRFPDEVTAQPPN